MSHRYSQITGNAQDELPNGKLEKRWQVDRDLRLLDLDRTIFESAGAVEKWGKVVQIECVNRGPIEDMPFGHQSRHVVSDRLRKWLEERAPGHAQFLPVHLSYRGQDLQIGQYWLANWLREVECHDPATTEWFDIKDGRGDPIIGVITLDPARVPSNTLVFLARHHNRTFIRDDLRHKLESAEMTGVHFLSVRHTGDPWPPPGSDDLRIVGPSRPVRKPARRSTRRKPL